MYLLDGRDAVDYDIQVIKGQLAFLGFVLSDLTRTACSPLSDYVTVLGDDVPQAPAGRRSLRWRFMVTRRPGEVYSAEYGGIRGKYYAG
ncbi:hypothetical protein CYMTET_6401 [Cymbomonas tetramitiformis]|uniref:Uncharacterized protein n=1 Tax=Cymbomonas tetramitiformis TaxID=36881 RepID=A0AAE0GZ34_9CHLO|nr:hypothetical protein CYMTET_6401 [Cymbomonas tetramitiformis]